MQILKRLLINLAILVGLGIFLSIIFPDIMNQVNEQNRAIFGLIVIVFLFITAISPRGLTGDQLEYPYFLRDDFLSPAEQSFYLTLKHTLADRALICPKVSLADLFYVKSSNQSEFWTYTNKINRKHVDFLLCDPKTAKPLLGIELDDQSHQKRGQEARDEFVEMVYGAANLPLVRIPVQRSYSASELESFISQHIGSNTGETPVRPGTTENEDAPPLCPKCGNEMVLRTAKRGANQGEQFWGCPDYPRCRGILKYEA